MSHSAAGASVLDLFQYHAHATPQAVALQVPGLQRNYQELYLDLLGLVQALRATAWARPGAGVVVLALRDPHAAVLMPLALEVLELPYLWADQGRVPGLASHGGLAAWVLDPGSAVSAGDRSWVCPDLGQLASDQPPALPVDRLGPAQDGAQGVRCVPAPDPNQPAWTVSRAVAQQRLLWVMMDANLTAGSTVRFWSTLSHEFAQQWLQAVLFVGGKIQVVHDAQGRVDPQLLQLPASHEWLHGAVGPGAWPDLLARAGAGGARPCLHSADLAPLRWLAPTLRGWTAQGWQWSVGSPAAGTVLARCGLDRRALLAPNVGLDAAVGAAVQPLWVASPWVAAPAHGGPPDGRAGCDSGLVGCRLSARIVEVQA